MQVEEFIHAYKTALASHSWDKVKPLIHKNASVTFSDGSVHRGKSAVKIAFERNFLIIKEEEYNIKNLHWLLKNESTAVYSFDFYWKGFINNKLITGSGVGTAVLVQEEGKWVLLTEHLGKKRIIK